MDLIKLQDTNLMQRNLMHLCALTTKYQKEKLRKQTHYKTNNLEINFTKEMKDTYTEKHKILIKETEEDTNTW